ncbi:MAG TPA: hypothetical protein VF232_11725 [Gaiellaceae bacterium]
MSRRLLVLGGAATASLALAASAFGRTQLLVTGATELGASATTVVHLRAETSDAAPSRVTIYLPLGYAANLGQTAGTQIGTVAASAQRLMLSPDAVDVPGTIVTDTPANYVNSFCAPGLHSAVWLVHLNVQGTTVDVPVYVDRTTGNEVPFSSAKLVMCLANPYAQAVPGTRAPTGLRLVDTKLTFSAGMVTNPTLLGSFVWRAVVTPWTANGAAANAPGTIETQSIVNIPSSLSLKAKVQTKRHTRAGQTTVTNSVLLSGKLIEDLRGVPGARITFFANGKTAGSAASGVSGAFSRKTSLARTTTLRATATVAPRETVCVSPLSVTAAPAGCVAATIAGYKVGSNTVIARPRKR